MNKLVLLDLLSELQMMTTGAAEWYRVQITRGDPAFKGDYEGFLRTALGLRDQMVDAISQVGGDPNYIAPVARMAQYTAERLMGSTSVAGALLPEEVAIVDLEITIILTDQAVSHWKLLAEPMGGGPIRKATQAIAAAVTSAVEGDDAGKKGTTDAMLVLTPVAEAALKANEQVLTWARTTWVERNQALLAKGPSVEPVWSNVISNPLTPITLFDAAPMTEGLLEGSQQPMWQPSPLPVLPKV
jgi:hypothetical protein